MSELARILHVAEGTIGIRIAEGELVQVQLANQNGPRRAQPLHDRGVCLVEGRVEQHA